MAISLHHPGRGFPSVSVTGTACELLCEHCRGRYLRGMLPAPDPDALLSLAQRFVEGGKEGFLLSGGCDRRGRVPLGPYLETVKGIKRSTPLRVNVHCGLVDREGAAGLAATGIDRVSLDVHSDGEVIRRTMHLEADGRDYERTLTALLDEGLRVVPHIIVGLSPRDEEASLDLIARHPVEGVAVLVLIGGQDVPRERTLGVIDRAVDAGIKVALGCMRPRGDRLLEREAIRRGISSLAVPSRETVQWARESGIETMERDDCCCLGIDGAL